MFAARKMRRGKPHPGCYVPDKLVIRYMIRYVLAFSIIFYYFTGLSKRENTCGFWWNQLYVAKYNRNGRRR